MGKTVIETRTVNRSPRESERAKLERTLVDGPAHSNAVRYALVFAFAFLMTGITLFLYTQNYTSFVIFNEVGFAFYWLAITVAMTTFVYKFFYHSTKYNLRHELYKLESRPQSEVVIETIEEDDALFYQDVPAPNAELITNKGNVLRHALPKYAGDYMFTGGQWDWLRRQVQKGDLYIRRDTSNAGIGWTDLEDGPPGAGNTVNERRKHFRLSATALRRVGYIHHSGKYTRLGFDEFLELPCPTNDDAQNHAATSGDGRADGQNGGAE